jgi:hypothetical protein
LPANAAGFFMGNYEQSMLSKGKIFIKWKTNLIDLSKRNRLLNFKDSATSVIKFNFDINQIFDWLTIHSSFLLFDENVGKFVSLM